jgi:hypothetical protein
MTYNFVVSVWYGNQGVLFLLGSHYAKKFRNHYQNISIFQNKKIEKLT